MDSGFYFVQKTSGSDELLGVGIHKKFETKFHLPFPLVADTDNSIAEKYGVWGLKKFMGREFIGTHRTTFIIDELGKIQKIIEKPDSKNHAEQIIALLKAK